MKYAKTMTASEEKKSVLGQYFTPNPIADFMSSMFSLCQGKVCSILDPGAGEGALSLSLANSLLHNNNQIGSLTAVELDEDVVPTLQKTLEQIPANEIELVTDSFIARSIDWIQFSPNKKYSHIIMNPPYKKILSSSVERKLLRHVEIETVNLYSGFVALGVLQLQEQGELVAIIPRSFCNGPYYKPFRKILLENTRFAHIHLFEKRDNIFKADNVLQENVIIKLVKDKHRNQDVKISHSTDGTFSDYTESYVKSNQVVVDDDPELFIRIPDNKQNTSCNISLNNTLSSLDLSVSTGPIVDFRVKPFLSDMPVAGTVPLIYPLHLNRTGCIWPQKNSSKPNAIFLNDSTNKMFFPSGYYCVVKRFSAKEEVRRIAASVISASDFEGYQWLGFENHLNVFHTKKQGIDKMIAYGLMIYLNSGQVDANFRAFNGHTQVNATDLRNILYPSLQQLRQMGEWALNQKELTFEKIDNYLGSIL